MSTPDSSTLPLKVCTKCGEEKSHADFARDRSSQDGLQRRCRACFVIYRAEHRSHRVAYQIAYDKAHPEDAARRHRESRARHRDEIVVKNAARYASDRERHLAIRAAWAAANPDKRAAIRRNRRARERAAEGTHTAADVQAQYDRQKGKCFYCGVRVGDVYHVDHVIPLARGGSNGPENVVIACPGCNLAKGAKHPMDHSGRLL